MRVHSKPVCGRSCHFNSLIHPYILADIYDTYASAAVASLSHSHSHPHPIALSILDHLQCVSKARLRSCTFQHIYPRNMWGEMHNTSCTFSIPLSQNIRSYVLAILLVLYSVIAAAPVFIMPVYAWSFIRLEITKVQWCSWTFYQGQYWYFTQSIIFALFPSFIVSSLYRPHVKMDA